MTQEINRIKELEASNRKLREGIDAVWDLIKESHGVAGLHLNGDIASWDELLEGGKYEEWLIAFSQARAANAALSEEVT